jgi:hypothetical protein
MNLPSKYILDVEGIKLNAYKLISLFYANKEIARSTDPEERDGIATLEDKFFFSEMSKLLIEIAISIRVLDDQMKSLPLTSDMKNAYISAMNSTNKRHTCMMTLAYVKRVIKSYTLMLSSLILTKRQTETMKLTGTIG